MTYSIASESLGGGVCFQACLLVCKGLGYTNLKKWSNNVLIKIDDIMSKTLQGYRTSKYVEPTMK